MGAGRSTPPEQSTLVVMGPRFRGADGGEIALLLLRGGALDKGLAALHLVGQRRFVDLDHDGVGNDAEILHQRLRDVAHHAGLLFIGAAGGHADGDFRHFWLLPFSCYVTLHEHDPHPDGAILHRRHHPRKRMIQYSAPVWFNGVTAYWMPAGACRRARRRRDPMAGMTASANSTSLHVYQESCGLRRPAKPAALWSGPRLVSADIRRDLFPVSRARRPGSNPSAQPAVPPDRLSRPSPE